MKNFYRTLLGKALLTSFALLPFNVSGFASSESSSDTALDIDVGYQLAKAPTPATHQCLDFQTVCDETTTIHMGSAVQPFITVNPKDHKKIISVFQQDRISNGGSLEAGIAYSHNKGETWHHTIVPFQICNGGIAQRTSDHTIAYRRDGKLLYLAGTVFNANEEPDTNLQSAIVVSRSENDGKTWEKPQIITSSQATLNNDRFPVFQKPFIATDPNNRHNAYLCWNEFANPSSLHAPTLFSFTQDDGNEWTYPRIIYDPGLDLSYTISNGNPLDSRTYFNTPVVLPQKSKSSETRLNGDILNFMTRIFARPGATSSEFAEDHFPYHFTSADIALIRSQDQGKNWNSTANVIAHLDVNSVVFTGGYSYDSEGNISGGIGTRMRTEDLGFSVAVNPKNGYLYVVWQTGRFRNDKLPQIALSTSRDGGVNWSEPVMINRTSPFAPNPQAFTPTVAVTKFGYVGIMYADFRNDNLSNPCKTSTDTWLAIYKETSCHHGGNTGIGLDFHKEVRLSQDSYIAQNGPVTAKGVMTNGDYAGLATHADRFYANYTKSFNTLFAPKQLFFEQCDCFSSSSSSCPSSTSTSSSSCPSSTSTSSSSCSSSTSTSSSSCSSSSSTTSDSTCTSESSSSSCSSTTSSSSCSHISSSFDLFSSISSLSSSDSVRGISRSNSDGSSVLLDQNLRTRPFISIVEQ